MDKSEVGKDIKKNIVNMVLQDALDILNADDGKPFEEKRAAVIELLTQKDNTEASQLLVERAIADKEGSEIKTAFWKFGFIIPASETIFLRPVEPNDRASFLSLQSTNSLLQSMEEKEPFLDLVWREHNEDKSLMLSIVKNGEYVGYCGIKNTAQPVWEIAIELLPEWRKHGIGFIALSAMLREMKSRLGVTQYIVRIEPTNLASQKLFEKLGATPYGIIDLWFHEQATIEKCEEAGQHLIDDDMIAVAKKFNVEPRKLLSHVLEYKLLWIGKEITDESI